MKNKLRKKALILGFAALSAVGCSDDGPGTDPTPSTGQYLVAAVFDGATYFLTAENLESTGSISATGNNGLEYRNTFSHFVSNGTVGLIGLKYGQGGAHVGAGFDIGPDGRARQVGNDFEIPSGFTTAGDFGQWIVTARSGQTLADDSKGAVVNFIDMENSNRLISRSLTTTDFPGLTDREVSLIGIEDAGNGEFYTGLSGATDAPFDAVHVARIDQNLNVQQVLTDSRIGVSGGGWRSARYSQIGRASNGDVYVFGGAAGPFNNTTKKAGAIVIKNGATAFDTDYYWDIQAAADDLRFRRVYHITEDYFLLEFYNDAAAYTSNDPATTYGIAKMSTRQFNWISGFPNVTEIPDRGTGWPFNYNGKMYIGVESATESPAIYVIDPVTATATKGLTVQNATSIPGMALIQ